MTKKIGIIGASGYTGAECARMIATHPDMEIAALAANSKAGMRMSQVYPHLRHMDLPDLVTWEDIDFAALDLVFCALPHKTSQEVIAQLPNDLKIVDLSADFRLRDPADYKKWYGNDHAAPDLQKEAVYGLTEFYRDQIKGARLVAGTGCNAATGQYMLRPLIAAGVIDFDDIILDLKVGASGAGRSAKELLLTAEMTENATAYSVGGKHRHLGEFDQEFSLIAGRPVAIQFTPHLIPASRGILATAYVKGEAEAIHYALAQQYMNEPFIHVLPLGEVPSMKDVRASNMCHIGVVADRRTGRSIVVGTLDNLAKGSSGQAMQNANLMLGLDETTGLMLAPVYP